VHKTPQEIQLLQYVNDIGSRAHIAMMKVCVARVWGGEGGGALGLGLGLESRFGGGIGLGLQIETRAGTGLGLGLGLGGRSWFRVSCRCTVLFAVMTV